MPENANTQGANREEMAMHPTLKAEVQRVRRMREDVLLLRFHLARRADFAKIIEAGDRLSSELALNSSLEVIENIERGLIPPVGHIAAASASLLDTIDKLVTAAHPAQEQDGTGDDPFPVTPESLRACLPKTDIAFALGQAPSKSYRDTANQAKSFLRGKYWRTVIFFTFAVLVQSTLVTGSKLLTWFHLLPTDGRPAQPLAELLNPHGDLETVGILISAFLWALVGSYVWILIRFRRFGATYTYDPALKGVFEARVVSGSITTVVLLYFVFGGAEPWAKNWQVDLPLWAFILGYAGKLQVELIEKMVERIQGAITSIAGGKAKGRGGVASETAPTTTAGAASAPASDQRPGERKIVETKPKSGGPGVKG